MSRGIDATNATHVEGDHTHAVILAKFEFDTPVYLHTGIGTLTYGGNDYLGVGDFGEIEAVEEAEDIVPGRVRARLSGIDSTLVTEALDAGNFDDPVTFYLGFRNDDNTLIADPEQIFSGIWVNSHIVLGQMAEIIANIDNDLLVLEEKSGRRYSDEDQQQEYSADTFFEYAAEMVNVKLIWGGRVVGANDKGGDQYPTDGGERFDT